jgi:tripartite-type tricarboxylate transporter receptor subunit TctC
VVTVDAALMARTEREMMASRTMLQSGAPLQRVEQQASLVNELLAQAGVKLGRASLRRPRRSSDVPFKGTPEALTEVMAGRIDWFFAPLVSALPLIKDGKLVALAVGTPKRSSVLPDVPTTVEAGYAGSDYTFWVGMFVPARTPAEVVARLHDETTRALNSGAVKERLGKLGAEAVPMAQPQFATLVHAEAGSAASLIKKVGMKVD